MPLRSLKQILFTVSIILYSCKQTNPNIDKEKTEYIKQLTTKDSIINILSKQAFNERKKADSIENFLLSKFINKEYVYFLFKEGDFLLDKGNLFKTILEELELQKENVMTSLFKHGYFYTSSDNNNINSKLGIINSLWNKIDRSPEGINKLLTKKDKHSIYSIFKENTIYEDSGISSIVKGLLEAYDEIENNEQSKSYFLDLKSNLYKTSDDFNENNDIYWESQRIANELLSSDKIKDILSDTNYTSYADSESDIENRVFYVYSFWCRRHKEANQDIVYQLLNEFHQNVSKNQ